MSAVVDTMNHRAGNNVYCVLSPQIHAHISIESFNPQNVRYKIRANVKELGSEYGMMLGSFIGRLIAHDRPELTRAKSFLPLLFKRYHIWLKQRQCNREQNRNTYLRSTSNTNSSLCVATEIMCIAHSPRLRRRCTAMGAGFVSVFRWNGEAGGRSNVALLKRSCFIPSVHIVCMFCYGTKLILYIFKFNIDMSVHH